MNIAEMHVYFRQYAQQMGMQNVRNILPEQIDVLLNTAISDKVNKIIKENVSVTNDRIISDSSKISHINSLKPLYKIDEVQFYIIDNEQTVLPNPAITFEVDEIQGVVTYTRDLEAQSDPDEEDYLFIVDFSINYLNVNNNGITRYFPVRLIDDTQLANTINDFVLRNRATSPILTIYNDNIYEIYMEPYINPNTGGSAMRGGLIPFKFHISYIAKPAEVYFDTEYDESDPQSEDNSVNCNLPEFLHVDIVKSAVDLYRNAINGGSSTYAPQENPPQQNEQTY